jgi:hypothetical protein
MRDECLPFKVTALDVKVTEPVKIKWQGREMDSGPLTIEMTGDESGGLIDYKNGTVNVEFHVRIAFPELAEILADMGADASVTAPVDAVIRSQGSVFDDHSLRLAGKGELSEHRLFNPRQMLLEIRAPSQ